MNPCHGKTPIFYSHGTPEILLAKALCGRCPTEDGCLDIGMALPLRTGQPNGTVVDLMTTSVEEIIAWLGNRAISGSQQGAS